jgi:catechol 2,3-dioxygenase-like lactoylglutathione lyase family enzyme
VLFKLSIPVLRVASSRAAEDFCCNRLGYRREFAYRVDESRPDPCYMGFTRDGTWLHVSSFSGDGVSGGVVYLLVEDVDALHAELVARGVRIGTGPVDQTWGNREMYVSDPDGNSIRFIEPIGSCRGAL